MMKMSFRIKTLSLAVLFLCVNLLSFGQPKLNKFEIQYIHVVGYGTIILHDTYFLRSDSFVVCKNVPRDRILVNQNDVPEYISRETMDVFVDNLRELTRYTQPTFTITQEDINSYISVLTDSVNYFYEALAPFYNDVNECCDVLRNLSPTIVTQYVEKVQGMNDFSISLYFDNEEIITVHPRSLYEKDNWIVEENNKCYYIDGNEIYPSMISEIGMFGICFQLELNDVFENVLIQIRQERKRR